MNRLDRAKRIDLLLEAAAREPGFRVVVAGDGPDRERLERLAPNGRVEFAGRVDEARLAEPTAAASRSTTRRSTRTTGSSRTRPSWRRSR